jgi:hypothetical protein
LFRKNEFINLSNIKISKKSHSESVPTNFTQKLLVLCLQNPNLTIYGQKKSKKSIQDVGFLANVDA